MPARLTVDLSALTHNYQLLASRFSGRTAAVVKADAYGLGAVPVANALAQAGCEMFFVAHLEEAIPLRAALPKQPIFAFHGARAGDEQAFIEHNITPVISSLEQLARWQPHMEKLPPALQVDTGMCRLGLTETDLAHAPAQGFSLIMSHLACANAADHPKNKEQLERFTRMSAKFGNTPKSLCNSAGIFLDNAFHFDIARPGCALYGIAPYDGDEHPMKHVATWSAPILQLRTLDRDETVGYGATVAFPKGSRIAILDCGYADGYLRALTNRGIVFFGNHAAPVVGRVSMDMIAVDVSHLGEAQLSEYADIICQQQTVNDLAQQCATIGYEIFTRIGARVVRNYQS